MEENASSLLLLAILDLGSTGKSKIRQGIAGLGMEY